jgi:hypothetical protein
VPEQILTSPPEEKCKFTRGKIPLYPPFSKGEFLLPPFVKECWGGFVQAFCFVNNLE